MSAAESRVLKCCSRCETPRPAERDECLGGLQATYRFTSLMSRRVCWEQDMIDSAATELEVGESQRGLLIKEMGYGGALAGWEREGIWHRTTCPSWMPGTRPPCCKSQRASSCYNPSSLVCEFNPSWTLSPVACLNIFHITHFSPQREINSKGGIPGMWLRMLLAVSRGEARPTLLKTNCTTSLSSTKPAFKEDYKKSVYFYLLTRHVGLVFNPFWGQRC